MKKLIGYTLTFIPMIVVSVSILFLAIGKQTLTIEHKIYLLITYLMLYGIYLMVAGKDERPKTKITWLRMVDVILLAVFVGTAIYNLRHYSSITNTDGMLIILCGLSMFYHEKIRDHRIARLLKIYRTTEEKRGLGDPAVTE